MATVKIPPRPDRPRVRVPQKKKPKGPKNTSGNVQVSGPPPGWMNNPYRWGLKGNFRPPGAPRPRVTTPTAPGASGGSTGSAGTPPPVDPYKDYPPWARRTLRQIDADQAASEAHGRSVQQWLTGALAPVQAAHQSSVANYQASMQNIPSLRVQNPAVQGMGGGNIQGGSPNQFVLNASNMASQGYNEVAQGQGAIQTFLKNAGMGNLRQTLEANLAGQLLQLPNQFKKEKNAYLAKLDEFLAGQEAAQAQFDAELARETTNDWYDFIATMGNQGVKLTDIQTDARTADKDRAVDAKKGSGGVVVNSASRPTTPGYTWYQEGAGKWRGIKIPTSGSGKGKPSGLIGPVKAGSRPPNGYTTVTSNGKLYFLKLSGTKGGGTGGGTTPAEMRQQRNDALDLWRGKAMAGAAPGSVVYSNGLNKAAVNGFTDPAGAVTSAERVAGVPAAQYVTNVRIYRLQQQLEAGNNDIEAVSRILRGIVGGGNYDRYVKWASKATNIKEARRRKHI